MRVKTRNLIELILQGIIIALLFIPGMYQSVFYQVGNDSMSISLGAWTRKSATATAISFWSKNVSFTMLTRVCVWVVIIAAVVGFILYLVQYLGENEKSNLKICIPFPFIELIAFIIPTFFSQTSKGVPGKYTSYTSFSPYFLFPVMIALIVALILLTFMGYSRAIKKGIIQEKTEKAITNSTADEIKKYKELYDEGAITEEEYENKKHQLLNS